MKKNITIPVLETPTRLDKFLTKELVDISRTYIQQAIRDGKVTVNDKPIAPHYFLKTGDIIKLNLTAPKTPIVKPDKKVKFNIIAQTDDFLVIDKPEGLVVHPAPGINESTLIDGLLALYPDIRSVGDDPTRPGIVHRLDRDVSGIMVVARSQNMFNNLKKQFKDRTIHKEYTALVTGEVQQPSGRIDFPLARSKSQHGKIAARPRGHDGDAAITEFTVIKHVSPQTLLNITILTGRTHQIRAHLAAFGYPLLGDKIYKPNKGKMTKKINRLFLHAHTLEFTDLAGRPQKFTSPLPKNLSDYLATLS